jgi:tetratricopeptide (TPR) repeat protein/transcriptional regulator with XRE-family HTH domain
VLLVKKWEPNDLLRVTRIRQGLSQEQLAALVGVHPSTIGRWERGEALPSPDAQEKLCAFFQMTPAALGLATSPSTLYDPAIPALPAIPLVGRDEQLTTIKGSLCAGKTVSLTALHGLPGVGKTTLAIALAHDPAIRQHFRDGILWAGLGPNPNIVGLLSHWGALLGIAQTESTIEAWVHAIHIAIGARQMLVIIDDVWKLEEALTFKVGGPQCAHLITTRFPAIAAHTDPAGPVMLQELDAGESMTLLRWLAPDVVEQELHKVQELVRAVGGLPLALTLMGNYLRKQAYSGQARRMVAALQRLSNAGERLHISEPHVPADHTPSLPLEVSISLESIIAVSDQQLNQEARAALYALSVFPAKPYSFSEEAALAVAACPAETMDALLDTGLLECNNADRYTLHQTIADYARLRLQGTEPHERLIRYVIQFVEEHKKDYALLEQESHIILHALDLAYELGMRIELVKAVSIFAPYYLRGYYSLAERHLQRAHQAAVELENAYDITTMLLLMGEVAQQQGNFGQAETRFQEGLRIARQIGNDERISALLNDLGWVAQKQGNLKQADIYLQEGLLIARRAGDRERVCGILKVLGMVTVYSGDYAQGEAYLQEGLALARQIGDQERACLLLINLGVAAGQWGNHRQAEMYYQEGLVLARQSGHRERISALLANLGGAASEQGNYQQAEEYCKEGLVAARQIEHREWISVLLTNLGLAMYKQGNYTQAEGYLRESLILARQIGAPQMVANVLYECGNFYLDQLQVEAARKNFNEMFDVIPAGCSDLVALAQYGLARSVALLGNSDEAKALGEESATTLEKLGHRKAAEVRTWLQTVPV